MKVTVNSITGFDEAFVAMYISKRSWTPELDKEIRDVCNDVLDRGGNIKTWTAKQENIEKFNKWLTMLLKMGKRHITLLKFIDISIMTEGLHRGGQDDIDSHAERFDNRIIRNSTRLATFSDDEMSEWYRGKILTTNHVLELLNIILPEKVILEDGGKFVKSTNGYIKEEFKDDKDVKRGLYPLSIPSDFVSKINLAQFGHVFKERNQNGGANPEVKIWAESVMNSIARIQGQITRDYVLSIEN